MLGALKFSSKPFLPLFEAIVNPGRQASKKAGGSSKNRKGHAPGKKRRLMRQDGDVVTSGTLIATQRPRFWFDDNAPHLTNLPLRFHPGQFLIDMSPEAEELRGLASLSTLMPLQTLHSTAGIGRNHTVYAMESGRVMITAEEFKPKWDHKIVSKQYAGREGQKIRRHYLHVIPDPMPQAFKLVDEI